MLTGESLSDYLKCFSDRVNITPQLIPAALPLGQSGDRYLIQAITACVQNPDVIVNYVVPCMRSEDEEHLANGSHLSLFHLYMFLFGAAVPEDIINDIYGKITNVSEITPRRIETQTAKMFFCQNYRFEKKIIETAKGFEYTNYAYEMFDEYENEIGNISRFENEKGIGVTTFAFGLERLVMHQFSVSNIWECPAFSSAIESDIGFATADAQRKHDFIDAHRKAQNPVHTIYQSTLLPLFG